MTPHRCGHTLANLVDPLRLNADAPRVIVGAINVATGLMEYFRGGQPGGLTFEHVAASGSLPPSFPMTTIGHHRYCLSSAAEGRSGACSAGSLQVRGVLPGPT